MDVRRRKAASVEATGSASGGEIEGHCPAENKNQRKQEHVLPSRGDEECALMLDGRDNIGQVRAGADDLVRVDGRANDNGRRAKVPKQF